MGGKCQYSSFVDDGVIMTLELLNLPFDEELLDPSEQMFTDAKELVEEAVNLDF